MSQEELAFKAGLNPAHLGQIERALKNPTIETISKIADSLDVPLFALFTDEQIEKLDASSVLTNKLNTYISKMNTEEQDDLLNIIKIFYKHLSK